MDRMVADGINHPRLRVLKSSGKIFAKIEWKDTSKNPTGSKNNSLSRRFGLGEGTQKVGPSPSRAKAAAIRRNPRLTHDVYSRQTRRLCALRLLAVRRRLRSRAPPEDYVKRAQPHQHRGADRHTRQLPLEVAVDPRVGVLSAMAAREAVVVGSSGGHRRVHDRRGVVGDELARRYKPHPLEKMKK